MNRKYLAIILLSSCMVSSSTAAVFGEGYSLSVHSKPGVTIDLDLANETKTLVVNSDGEANIFWSVSKSYAKEHGYGLGSLSRFQWPELNAKIIILQLPSR